MNSLAQGVRVEGNLDATVWGEKNAENTNRATHLHGDRVVRFVALYHRISIPGFLERHFGDCVVAVLPWALLQGAGAFTAIEMSRSGE